VWVELHTSEGMVKESDFLEFFCFIEEAYRHIQENRVVVMIEMPLIFLLALCLFLYKGDILTVDGSSPSEISNTIREMLCKSWLKLDPSDGAVFAFLVESASLLKKS
jgi:hypothetical protein